MRAVMHLEELMRSLLFFVALSFVSVSQAEEWIQFNPEQAFLPPAKRVSLESIDYSREISEFLNPSDLSTLKMDLEYIKEILMLYSLEHSEGGFIRLEIDVKPTIETQFLLFSKGNISRSLLKKFYKQLKKNPPSLVNSELRIAMRFKIENA